MVKTTKPTLDELRTTAAEVEGFAQRSAGYYAKDTGQRNSVIQALVRVAEAHRRIAVHLAGPKANVSVSLEEMLSFRQEAGEIATISMMLRNGDVSEINQKAIAVKLGTIARDVARKQAGVPASLETLKPEPTAYAWTPPAYEQGQRVRFWWRKGIERSGVLMSVVTRYRDGIAWHSYAISAYGHKVLTHVAAKDILHAE